MKSKTEIYSARLLPFPVAQVYEAFANPEILKKWWGPEGFTNTIHEFDLQPGGAWKLTMHGPEKGHYENASVFQTVLPMQKIAWTRQTQPLFDMEVGFEDAGNVNTNFSFRMIFGSEAECNKMRPFVAPKNEENFDRLQRVLADWHAAQ